MMYKEEAIPDLKRLPYSQTDRYQQKTAVTELHHLQSQGLKCALCCVLGHW